MQKSVPLIPVPFPTRGEGTFLQRCRNMLRRLMPILELRNLCKSYAADGRVSEVLHNVNLSIEEGEFVAIVGFSGSGKTTLINSIAGLVTPDSGEVLMHGKPVTNAGPDRGLVFQSYSLFPWLTVRGNVLLAVQAVNRAWTRRQQHQHVDKYINMVGLSHAVDRRPAELSGGMRQRAELARVLAGDSDILLMDEPFSALDYQSRLKMRAELIHVLGKRPRTVVFVTHDIEEAAQIADRVLVLSKRPATVFYEIPISSKRPRTVGDAEVVDVMKIIYRELGLNNED